MEKVRFGIVGCGNMGSGHAKNFLQDKIANGKVTAVCDLNPKKFEFFKEKFGDRVFATSKKMGAETAEANMYAGLAAARQSVGYLLHGENEFQVNK